MKMYCSSARLMAMKNELDLVENKIERLRTTFHIDYYILIYTEKVLAKSLRKELELRNLDTRSDHVVLMFESDTVYGRSLRDTIAREFTDDKSGPLQIDPYSYLRGLDGQIPEMKLTEKISSVDESDPIGNNRPANDSSKVSSAQNEIADGQGQLDYLQRLANHLHELDNELRRDGTSKIGAVGILGSDVYDKHLLVEALKPELPQAVFFTTDLDALLLPHGKFRSTRNLIVASSYGFFSIRLEQVWLR